MLGTVIAIGFTAPGKTPNTTFGVVTFTDTLGFISGISGSKS